MQFQSRIYYRNECTTFLKTAEQFGGLSNMAGGYPLLLNDISIYTSEALYQACRFPHKSELQKLIISQKSPMTAKMKSKPYRSDSRSDWDEIRVQVMWWCLRVKLAQHWEKFGGLLLSTDNKFIVEESYRDQFWGAKPVDSKALTGFNVLGQLLTHLRERLKGSNSEKLKVVFPLLLPQFFLMGKPIELIKAKNCEIMLNHAALIDQPTKEALNYPEEKDTINFNRNITQSSISTTIVKEQVSLLLKDNKSIQLTFDC
ncbi:MAG: NADAR family protein [Ktedonobacteraceae bacterium]